MLLTLAAVPATTSETNAGVGWCRTDPIMLIDGNIVDIFVTGPLLTPLYVTGPNHIVISVPREIDAHLVLAGPGFGRGEKVTVEKRSDLKVHGDSFEVEVKAYVPARKNIDIGVEFAPNVVGVLFPDRATGKANEWVTLRTTLPVR